MKRILCLGFLLLALNAYAQQLTPVLGPIVSVTPTNSTGNTRPRIVLINDNIPLVTWTKTGSGNGVIYSARWNGSGFDTAVQVTPSGINVYCSVDEGGDIASRGDTVFIVFFTTTNKVYSVRSVDGGLSWGDTVRVDHAVVNMAYTPDVQVMPGGNPVIVYEGADITMTIAEQLVCRSYDGGITYTSEVQAHTSVNGTPCECCPPAILARDSSVYILYRNNDNNTRNIVMTISADSGNTFPVVSEFDQSNWVISACPTSGSEAMFYRDSVLAVWKSGNKVYFGCGSAIDGSEGTHHLIEPTLPSTVQQKQPSVCGNQDTIVYTWSDRRTNTYDVYVAVTSAGAVPVTLPCMFNDTMGLAENGTQHNPHAVYNGGYVHLVYADIVTGKTYYRRAEVVAPTGLADYQNAVPIQVFPSPATSSFSFASGTIQKAQVQIYSVTGVLVATHSGVMQGEAVNCADLAAGIYSIVITDEKGIVYTSQLVKQ